MLISVKNVEEAKIAFKAGVDLIDLKDPEKGAMGMIDFSLVSQIQNSLPSDLSFSMACGELRDMPNLPLSFPNGMTFYKFGMSHCENSGVWFENLLLLKDQIKQINDSAFIVPVLYADFLNANSIKPLQLLEYLCDHSFYAIMIDTWLKDGSSVLDWITISELLKIQNKCNDNNIKFALAGSIDLISTGRLIAEGVMPAWFGYRGAICLGRSRNQTIDFDLTLDLVAGVKRLSYLGAS